MSRNVLSILLLAWFVLPCAAAGETSGSRNVLLLISDDQGLDAGCYGSRAVRTPNIDRLASQGARFTNAFAAVSSCSPSRATIMSGMYNHQNGQYGLTHAAHNQRTRPEVQTLPRLLWQSGYRTGIIGKNHLATDDVYPFESKTGPNAGRDPAKLRQLAREFMASAQGKPFFLAVGFSDPHRAAGSRFIAEKSEAEAILNDPKTTLPAVLMDLPEVRRDFAEYCASVNNLDRCVGAVIAGLDEAGMSSSTLVIFMSDNGIPFPGAKTNLYDAGIHLPLIVRSPEGGRGGGAVVDDLASWIDIAPTILGWAGLKPPAVMRGRSLLTVPGEAARAGAEQVFASHTFHEITMYYPMRCVRTRTHKLIWNLAHELKYPVSGDIRNSPTFLAVNPRADGMIGGRAKSEYYNRPEFELYDVVTDPDETHNLAGVAGQAERVKQMHAELLKMMRETKDPWAAAAGGGKEGE